MYNFTFKLQDLTTGKDLKPAVLVQVQAETLALARTQINTDFTPYGAGTMVSAQQIKELDTEDEESSGS